jgi:FMN phosphatase YigB (HAD superfamily)
MRIVFDMDGTLVGYGVGDGPYGAAVNPVMAKVLRNVREAGHETLLWTGATRAWYEMLSHRFPVLRSFDEVYAREDLPSAYRAKDGQVMFFKDLRLVGADVLFDNDPNHERRARELGLMQKYITVPTFGTMAIGTPGGI